MKKLTYSLSLIVAIFLMWSYAAADDAKPTGDAKPAGPMSLQQCLDIAMQDQTDLIVARNNLVAAKNRAVQARSGYFPQLSLQANAFHYGQGVLNKVTNGTAFSIDQNIWDGGLREAQVSGTRYGVKQSDAGLTRTFQTTTYNVTKSYYELLRAKHLAEVSGASVKYTEELQKQVKARADEGDAATVDVLPFDAQLANAKVSQLSAQNAVRTAALDLQTTIGMSPARGFDVQDMDAVPNPEVRPLDNYIKTAITARPDIAQSMASSGVARASVKSARLNLYPRPVLSGQYQHNIQGGFTSSGTQVVGGVVFDIFNGGANRAAYKEARATQANAEQEYKQLNKDIEAQVEEAYLNLTNSKERLAATELGLTAAQKNYEVQKDRYNQGLAIPLDLLNAEVQLVTAQSNAVQARYDYLIAISQMDYAVGKQGGFNAN